MAKQMKVEKEYDVQELANKLKEKIESVEIVEQSTLVLIS